MGKQDAERNSAEMTGSGLKRKMTMDKRLWSPTCLKSEAAGIRNTTRFSPRQDKGTKANAFTHPLEKSRLGPSYSTRLSPRQVLESVDRADVAVISDPETKAAKLSAERVPIAHLCSSTQ